MSRGVRTLTRNLMGAAIRVVRPASILLVPVPEAETALRTWQRQVRVETSGVASRETWKALQAGRS